MLPSISMIDARPPPRPRPNGDFPSITSQCPTGYSTLAIRGKRKKGGSKCQPMREMEIRGLRSRTIPMTTLGLGCRWPLVGLSFNVYVCMYVLYKHPRIQEIKEAVQYSVQRTYFNGSQYIDCAVCQRWDCPPTASILTIPQASRTQNRHNTDVQYLPRSTSLRTSSIVSYHRHGRPASQSPTRTTMCQPMKIQGGSYRCMYLSIRHTHFVLCLYRRTDKLASENPNLPHECIFIAIRSVLGICTIYPPRVFRLQCDFSRTVHGRVSYSHCWSPLQFPCTSWLVAHFISAQNSIFHHAIHAIYPETQVPN